MIANQYQDRNRFIKKVIFWSILFGALLSLFLIQTKAMAFISIPAFAQPVDVCQDIGGCIKGTGDIASGKDGVVEVVLNIAKWFIYVIVAIAALFIVLGGWKIVTGGTADSYKEGIATLRNAVIGMVLAIISLTIVQVISNIVLGTDVLNS